MALNNNALPNLSRYSIGEIVDLSGVPTFYNAGSSKWLRSGQATASSNLSTTSKTNLAAAGTAAAPTVLAQSALSNSYMASGLFASYPIQRISASSISVVPSCYSLTTAVGVGVMTSAGVQTIATGQTSARTNSSTGGTNGVVASNNTTIFSYCFTSATALSAYYTTNGTTWTAGSVTGLPVFATDANTIAWGSQINNNTYTVAGMIGWKRTQSANSQFMVFWCGARFLLIGPGASYYVLSLSTDGLAFGGDNTNAVLGSTTRAKTLDMQFYRNGNNCFLNIGTIYRYSTDGGVTWAASTFAGAPSPTTYYLQINTTDPAKLVIVASPSGTATYYSADSGATWSASRPLPSNYPYSLYYKGSTLCVSFGGANDYRVSTDDGVTWSNINFPIGTLGSIFYFYADAYRWYAGGLSQPQLFTSSDAITWTLVTLSQNYALNQKGVSYGTGIVAFDSNTVVIMGNNSASGNSQFISTTDGGVTWTMGQYTVSNYAGEWGVGSAFVTPDAGGVGCYFGMTDLQSGENGLVLKADITGGGAFYRTGTTAITPLRTNALAFVRVG